MSSRNQRLAWVAGAVSLLAGPVLAEGAGVPQAYVMRHLDRTKGGDSLKKPRGFNNACRLARWFRERPLAAIHVARFRRARQTAEPTARVKGLTLQPFQTTDAGVAAIRRSPRPMLVVGNTRTVQKLVAAAGGKPPPQEPTGFGRIWIIYPSGKTIKADLPTYGPACEGMLDGKQTG